MDQKQSIIAQKAALIQRMDAARREVSASKALVTEKIISPVRTVQKLKSSPLPWLVGSGFLAFGSIFFLKSLIPRPSKHKKHGLVKSLLLSSAFSLVKPYVKDWATAKMTEYLTKYHRR